MELDGVLIAVIKYGVFEDLNNGLSIEEFCKNLKERSLELGIDYYTLLKLVLNRDYLFLEVYNQVFKVNKRLEELQKEINELCNRKKELCSLICSLHGHRFNTLTINSGFNTCDVCGENIKLDGTEVNSYIRKMKKLNTELSEK